jgi:ubiquinone/menaquinone biosynthesis C-methylase UbiE
VVNNEFDIKYYEKSFYSLKKNYSNSYQDFDEIYHGPYIKYHDIINKKISKKSSVLDLCVGDGIHSIILAKASKDYTAIEPTKSGLEILKSKLDNESITNYKLVNSKIEKFYTKSTYDFISIINSTSYFDITELTRIFRNNLKKGGTLIIIDSLRTNPIYRINHL